MRRFAFLIHPLSPQDITKKFKPLGALPDRVIEALFSLFGPAKISHITGVRSLNGEEAEGWFIVLPRTPRQLLAMPAERAYDLITRAGRIAERLGAEIFGLGAFTKVIGDKGITIARRLTIPVTTGNSYTAATAVEGALLGAQTMGADPSKATATVLGASGAIGRACALMLGGQVERIRLVGRRREPLAELAEALAVRHPGPIETFGAESIASAVTGAQIVIAVTSATDAIVDPSWLDPGAVVCDVARPRNLSPEVNAARRDVLVIDGGVIRVPGSLDLGMGIGFPPGCVEACIAETMILALEGRLEPFTLGDRIEPEKVLEIHALGKKHGFAVTGFRRFEKEIPADEIEERRALAARRRAAAALS
ncbi:MAG TPA: shikimate dehydrogenase [Limnochordia bacterium]